MLRDKDHFARNRGEVNLFLSPLCLPLCCMLEENRANRHEGGMTFWPPLPPCFNQYQRLAGLDEVGRGPLAGPVVAAAVILPRGFLPEGLADSKALTAAQRLRLAALIKTHAAVGIGFVPAPVIDRINIRQASLLAMRRAFFALHEPAEAALIDGRDVPEGLDVPALAIIKGDQRVAAIAAASIIAKVARDAMMAKAAQDFPQYGFDQHAGYPTQQHRAALLEFGLSPLHRRSFGPCKWLE